MSDFKIVKKSLLYIAVIFSIFFALGPILWMFLSALRSKTDFFNIPATFFPKRWTIENFISLFVDTKFPTFIKNSLLISVFTILITILVSSLGAYILSRFDFKGRKMIAIFSLFAYMLPPILLAIPLYMILAELRMINTYTSLIIAYVGLSMPYSVWILREFFKGLPYVLEEAAYIDGAGRLRILFSVVLPLSLPGIIATTVFSFNVVWNEFLFALIFMSSDRKMTFPVGLNTFVTEYDVYWEYILSGSIFVSIPALAVFMLTQKYLIKGWGAGGIKG